MKTTLKVVLLLTVALFFANCKKEKIKGCTDVNANNYKSTAEQDDGSCQFSAKLVFWQKSTNASTWSSHGVTSLKFYVNNSLVGSCAANVYYNGAPSCSSNGLASTKQNLGSSKTKSVSYSVKDQSNVEWYVGNISLDASNSCKTFELQ